MSRSQSLSFGACAALLVLGATTLWAQAPPPKEAFKAVHIVKLSESQVVTLQAALADLNAVLTKLGHPDIRYRLYRVAGPQSGPYNYVWESIWPSGEVYQKVHDSPEWAAAQKRHPEMEALMKDELYNRYVEVTPVKK